MKIIVKNNKVVKFKVSNKDTWNLDAPLGLIISEFFKLQAEVAVGSPDGDFDKHIKELKEVSKLFKEYANDDWILTKTSEQALLEDKRKFELFAKLFHHLWT